MKRDHNISFAQALKTYLDNRQEFYDTMLERIPNSQQRGLLREAAGFGAVEPIPIPSAVMSADAGSETLLGRELFRLDLLKKPGFGKILGRSVISFYEALDRARQVEETGYLLLSEWVAGIAAVDALASEREARREAFARLIKLEDDLRHHRIQAE